MANCEPVVRVPTPVSGTANSVTTSFFISASACSSETLSVSSCSFVGVVYFTVDETNKMINL